MCEILYQSSKKMQRNCFMKTPNGVVFVCMRGAAFSRKTFWAVPDCISQESVCDRLQKQLKGKEQCSLMKMDVYERVRDVNGICHPEWIVIVEIIGWQWWNNWQLVCGGLFSISFHSEQAVRFFIYHQIPVLCFFLCFSHIFVSCGWL